MSLFVNPALTITVHYLQWREIDHNTHCKGEYTMKDEKIETPFFAKYLEEQEFPQVKTNVKAGQTLKYPSDRDEWEP